MTMSKTRLFALLTLGALTLTGCQNDTEMTYQDYMEMSVDEQIDYEQEQQNIITLAVTDLSTIENIIGYDFSIETGFQIEIDEGYLLDKNINEREQEHYQARCEKLYEYFTSKDIDHVRIILRVKDIDSSSYIGWFAYDNERGFEYEIKE